MRPPRPIASLRHETRGAIFVEFLVTSVPLLILFLLLVQLALGFTAKLTVQHAANAAARAAIVVLPDDPRYYGGTPQNTVSGGGGGAFEDELDGLLQGLSAAPASAGTTDNPRLRSIRAAAAMRLMGVSPAFSAVSGDDRSIARVLGAEDDTFLTGSARYTRRAVAVSFPDGVPSEPDGDVTVRVTYLFYCGIPLGDLFLCRGGGELEGIPALAQTASPWRSLTASGARFLVLRSEATLPNQGFREPYDYAEEGRP